MPTVTLQREKSKDEGTFGVVSVEAGAFTCVSGELPWRDNAIGISCIPAGTYPCTYRNSPSHGMCYHVENVLGRTDVEIHSANFVGALDKGYKCQLLGCIALGLSISPLDGQMAVRTSRDAVAAFENYLGKQTFTLIIKDAE